MSRLGFEILTDPDNGTREGDWYVWDLVARTVPFRGNIYQCCMWVSVEGPIWRVRHPYR